MLFAKVKISTGIRTGSSWVIKEIEDRLDYLGFNHIQSELIVPDWMQFTLLDIPDYSPVRRPDNSFKIPIQTDNRHKTDDLINYI